MILNSFLLFRNFVNANLNKVLILSVLIGLFVPGIEYVPEAYVPYILGAMVFFLCAKISIKEIQDLPIKEALLFYVLRFIAFPLVLYFLASLVVPQFAIGILLIALMPVGLTTPALVGTLYGSVALAFVLAIVSSLLAPFVIPFMFLLVGDSTNIQIANLSYTLFTVIFIPSLLYITLIKIRPTSSIIIKEQSSFLSILLLGAIISVVIAKQKAVFFSDFMPIAHAAFFCSVLFFSMYLFGWFYYRKNNPSRVIAYTLSSGASNNALAISLALLYFPPDIIFFVIVSQLSWVLAIPIFNMARQYFLKIAY